MSKAHVGFSMRGVEQLSDAEYAQFVVDCAEIGLVMRPGERADLSDAARMVCAEVSV